MDLGVYCTCSIVIANGQVQHPSPDKGMLTRTPDDSEMNI